MENTKYPILNLAGTLSKNEFHERLEELFHYVGSLVEYTVDNEWNYVEESLYNECEPRDTTLWHALMCNHLIYGATHPSVRFMEEIDGLQVSEEGIITNKEEFFNQDA